MNDLMYQNLTLYLDNKLQEANLDFDVLFKEIESKYSTDAVVFSVNYILKAQTSPLILDNLIRYTIKNPNKKNLPALIDFVIKPVSNSNIINLKVLTIKSFPKYKDTSVVQTLLFCLNDKNSNYKIKLASADALGKIGDKNAFESLGKILTDEKEESAYVKESAVTALGMLGDDRAIEVFSSIMDAKQIFKDKFSFLKEKIMEAVGKFDISKNKKALELIKKSLYDPSPNVRISAIETLMESEIEDSYEMIFDVFKFDSDIEVKKNALVALFNISCDIKVLEDVIRGDYPEELKNFAIETIKEIEVNEDE